MTRLIFRLLFAIATLGVPPAEAADRGAGNVFRYCTDCPEMVVIPAGTFTMGSPDNEQGRWADEGPQHEVRVKAFALGRTHITRGQYAAFAKDTGRGPGNGCSYIAGNHYEKDPKRSWRDPGFAQTDRDPVVCVSFEDANAFIAWLNRKVGKDVFRLPSEAEWEYASRAGGSNRPWGEEFAKACRFANVADRTAKLRVKEFASFEFHDCADGFAYTSPVGSFPKNAFGLFDMIGNARQHTADCYHSNYIGAPDDGSAWLSLPCETHSARGGSFSSSPRYARAAKRFKFTSDDRYVNLGFRVARSL